MRESRKTVKTCLERSAGTSRAEAAEENRVEVGTRSEVVLTKHVAAVNVQLAAFLSVLIDQLLTVYRPVLLIIMPPTQ